MLGPSDFRKNCSNLILATNQREETFKKILDFRLKNFNMYSQLINKLKNKDKTLFQFIDYLPWNKYMTFIELMNVFHNYLSKKNFSKNKFADISLGNIIFTAFFLKSNNSFNLAVKNFSKYFEIEHKILNVTNGKNLFLCALTEKGSFLQDEVSIIENKKRKTITDIFLTKKIK